MLAAGLSACTLVTSLDGLAGDDNPDAGDAGDAGDAALGVDAPTEASNDTGVDADTGTSCGFAGPTQGLLAYYAFEEGTGNVVHDCTANHFDGTIVRQGTGGNWATGKKGGAIRVQAPNGCVDVGMPAKLQPPALTVAMWVTIATYPAPPASGYLIGQSLNADTNGWRIGSLITDTINNHIGWQHTTGGTKYAFLAPGPMVSTWHHVATTFKPNDKLEVFIDGVSKSSGSAIPAITYVPVSLRMGCRADDQNYIDGLIDEVRIYDRVLTAPEIALLAAP
jgi:hypothetical protein